MPVCQNSLVPALDAGSHKNWPYKYLTDKACSFAAPRQARGQVHFDIPPIIQQLKEKQKWKISAEEILSKE